MNLAKAALVYAVLVLILCLGVFFLVAGKPWLFIIAVPVYLIAFAKIGCLSQH